MLRIPRRLADFGIFSRRRSRLDAFADVVKINLIVGFSHEPAHLDFSRWAGYLADKTYRADHENSVSHLTQTR